jgi:hypothetical protein
MGLSNAPPASYASHGAPLGGCAPPVLHHRDPGDRGDPAMPEEQLLDVGVRLFASGAEQLKKTSS